MEKRKNDKNKKTKKQKNKNKNKKETSESCNGMTNVSSWALGVPFGCATGGSNDCDDTNTCGLACLMPMCQRFTHSQSNLLLQFFKSQFTHDSEGWGLSDFKAQPVYTESTITTINGLLWFVFYIHMCVCVCVWW